MTTAQEMRAEVEELMERTKVSLVEEAVRLEAIKNAAAARKMTKEDLAKELAAKRLYLRSVSDVSPPDGEDEDAHDARVSMEALKGPSATPEEVAALGLPPALQEGFRERETAVIVGPGHVVKRDFPPEPTPLPETLHEEPKRYGSAAKTSGELYARLKVRKKRNQRRHKRAFARRRFGFANGQLPVHA